MEMNVIEQINLLKRGRNAIILAHNYVPGEVQDVADFVGDSLELSIRAQNADAPVIVCCGVSFMAETVKILSPESIVLHPVPSAGCPMADMVTAQNIKIWKFGNLEINPESNGKNEKSPNSPISRFPNSDKVVIAYVNTTAAVKAEVDICCTSSNAERVVRSVPADKKILFLPDRNLGANVIAATGREMELWPGCCPIHDRITPEMALTAKARHPNAPLIVHPECLPAVVAVADKSLSTAGMLRFVNESPAAEFIIGTEHGILHRMRKENPGKIFHTLDIPPTCDDMKKITLESVADALENMRYQVELPPALLDAARKPIEKMLNC